MPSKQAWNLMCMSNARTAEATEKYSATRTQFSGEREVCRKKHTRPKPRVFIFETLRIRQGFFVGAGLAAGAGVVEAAGAMAGAPVSARPGLFKVAMMSL